MPLLRGSAAGSDMADSAVVWHRGYFGTAEEDSEDRIVRPVSVYCPNKRTVAIASKVTGTHIPPTCANCKVIWMFLSQKDGLLAGTPSIRRIRKVLASTQICPRKRFLSFLFGGSLRRTQEHRRNSLA